MSQEKFELGKFKKNEQAHVNPEDLAAATTGNPSQRRELDINKAETKAYDVEENRSEEAQRLEMVREVTRLETVTDEELEREYGKRVLLTRHAEDFESRVHRIMLKREKAKQVADISQVIKDKLS